MDTVQPVEGYSQEVQKSLIDDILQQQYSEILKYVELIWDCSHGEKTSSC